jgi:hypothetical protein
MQDWERVVKSDLRPLTTKLFLAWCKGQGMSKSESVDYMIQEFFSRHMDETQRHVLLQQYELMTEEEKRNPRL